MKSKPAAENKGNPEGPDPHSLNCLLLDSSIHGVKFLSQTDRPMWERVAWLVLILSSAAGAAFFVYGVMDQYYASPVIVSFQTSQTSIAQIPFPAVTVCSINRFRKSAFISILENVRKLQVENKTEASNTEASKNISQKLISAMKILRAFENICQGSNSFHVHLNYSLNETTTNLNERGINLEYDQKITLGEAISSEFAVYWDQLKPRQTCPEMIPLCVWEGEPVNCTTSFIHQDTRFGSCCTFNMNPEKFKQNNLSDYNSRLHGKISNDESEDWLSFDIDKHIVIDEEDETENKRKYPRRQSKAGQGSGLSFLLVPELDEYYCGGNSAFGYRILAHPPMEDAKVKDFGMAVGPGVEAFLNVQADLTLADENIKDLYPETRYCYFSHEQPLDLFRIYTQNNCVDECIANLVLANCSCIRLDLPIPKADENLEYCEGERLKCSEDLRAVIGQVAGDTDDINSTYCKDCFPSCNRIDYRVQTSTLPLRVDPTVWTDENDKTASWAKEKVSIVHVYFGSDSVYSRVRKKLYGTNDLIANIGGILGLFLGLSIIGIIEPAFYIVKLIWLKISK